MKNIFMKKAIDTYLTTATKATKSPLEVWRWGQDNMLPIALTALSRSSVTHRRIIIDKADYISGRGFKSDLEQLTAFTQHCNGLGQSLRNVIQCVAMDKCVMGNAFIEVVRVADSPSLSLYHQDASRCRLARDKKHIIMHHDWSHFKAQESVQLSIYPTFEAHPDGTLRAMIHYKDYEPMFENYGSPKYLAALDAIAIAHKTDRWNITRLDNSFQASGVMVLDGDVDSPQDAAQIAIQAEKRFAGNPGQVMFMVKNGADNDTTKFVPITSSFDGDWRELHEQSTTDIIVAHSWFRTLSGLEYVSGFSADRVRNEYDIALSTVIRTEQQELMEPIRKILNSVFQIDSSSLEFINLPPFDAKPAYMYVWEARKADGLDYDPQANSQACFLANL
ncbi:MAG: phage portal protein [Mucinivorans sp.]